MQRNGSGDRPCPFGSTLAEAPDDLKALVGRLNMAVKACAAYPSDHPVATALLRAAYGATSDALENHGPLVFVLAEDQLILNGYQFRGRERGPGRLAKSLRERDVKAVTLEPTPEFDGFARLLWVLGRPVVDIARDGGSRKCLGEIPNIAVASMHFDRPFSVPAVGDRTWEEDWLASAVARYMAGTGQELPDPGLLTLLELLKHAPAVQYALREDPQADPASAQALAAAIRRLLVAVLTQAAPADAEALAARLAELEERFRPLAELGGELSASDVIEATEDLSPEALAAALDAALEAGVLSRENLIGALGHAVAYESVLAVAPEAGEVDGDRRHTADPTVNETTSEAADSAGLAELIGGSHDRRSHARMLADLLADEDDPDMVAPLVASLEDLAFEAIEAGEGDVVLHVVLALRARSGENESPAILSEVTGALQHLAAQHAVEEMLGRMGSAPEESSREAFCQVLLALGEPALDACQSVLVDPDDPEHGAEAAGVLVRGGPPGLSRVAQILDEAPPAGRGECVEALGHSGDAAAAPTLARALDDPLRSIRKRAAMLLGHLDCAEVIPALGAVGRRVGWLDRDHVVREEAVRALCRLNTAEAAQELARVAEAGSLLARGRARRVARAAAHALARMDDPAAASVLEDLRRSKRRLARAAARRVSLRPAVAVAAQQGAKD